MKQLKEYLEELGRAPQESGPLFLYCKNCERLVVMTEGKYLIVNKKENEQSRIQIKDKMEKCSDLIIRDIIG